MRTFRAVIFDLDGVLTDTARYHYQAWKHLAGELGIALDEDFNETLKGVSRLESLQRILRHGGVTCSDAEQQRLAARKNNHYRELIATMSPADLLPGARDVLDYFQRQRIPLALASASRNAPDILHRLGLSDDFTAIADPAAVARGKPYPDLFLAAADGLSVAPGACLGIEDAQAGIAAIQAAGMYALGIGSTQQLSAADEVIPNLAAFDPTRYRWQRA